MHRHGGNENMDPGRQGPNGEVGSVAVNAVGDIAYDLRPRHGFGGFSAQGLAKAHRQRLLAFFLVLFFLTAIFWEIMTTSWRSGLLSVGRLRKDSLGLMGAALGHCLAAFSRYHVSTAASTVTSPLILWRAVVVLVVHAIVGVAHGWCLWGILTARGSAGADSALVNGRLVGQEALASLLAGGLACGLWSALTFMGKRGHELKFSIRVGELIPTLHTQTTLSLWVGAKLGFLFSFTYLLFRFCVGPFGSTVIGQALVAPGGSAQNYAGRYGKSNVEGDPGALCTAYVVFLLVMMNGTLFDYAMSMLRLFITEPQDFMGLWQANVTTEVCGGGGSRGASPTLRGVTGKRKGAGSPAAMLLDALLIGQEGVVLGAGQAGTAGGREGDSALLSMPDNNTSPMGEWAEEVELQRRALFLAAMATDACSLPGQGGAAQIRGGGVGVGGSSQRRGHSRGMPMWAEVTRVQGFQSLALKAPTSKELRMNIYEHNITQVLRCLCLELDCTTLLLQRIAFRKDSSITPRLLGCHGRRDIRWLAQEAGPSQPEMPDRGLASQLGTLISGGGDRGVSAGGELRLPGTRGGTTAGAGARGDRQQSTSYYGSRSNPELPASLPTPPPQLLRNHFPGRLGTLSETRAQRTVWAAEGLATLMVSAPGESPVWSLEPMLPVALGSLAALLLAVHGLRQTSSVPRLGGHQLLPPELQGLARAVEKGLADISRKYRPRLQMPSFRFPPAYAAVISEHCPP